LVDRLNKEIARVVAQPDVQERFASVGAIASPSTPAEYVNFILRENKKWGEIVRVSGASPD
jgi:tripartite-type tricarboxylate transporter receptor subunit TctC